MRGGYPYMAIQNLTNSIFFLLDSISIGEYTMAQKPQNTINNWLNDTQYKALLELYNNFNIAFQALPQYIREAFYARLYS